MSYDPGAQPGSRVDGDTTPTTPPVDIPPTTPDPEPTTPDEPVDENTSV